MPKNQKNWLYRFGVIAQKPSKTWFFPFFGFLAFLTHPNDLKMFWRARYQFFYVKTPLKKFRQNFGTPSTKVFGPAWIQSEKLTYGRPSVQCAMLPLTRMTTCCPQPPPPISKCQLTYKTGHCSPASVCTLVCYLLHFYLLPFEYRSLNGTLTILMAWHDQTIFHILPVQQPRKCKPVQNLDYLFIQRAGPSLTASFGGIHPSIYHRIELDPSDIPSNDNCHLK